MYVLAIGVSRYPEAGQDLPFAAVDAQAVAELLRGNLRLFSRVDVRLLTDQSATRQAILSGLEWLRQSATPQDVAIVFYAGRSSNDERHGLHLLPVDADRVQPGASGIPESLLRGAVESTRGRVLVWMDARDSDAAGQRQGYCVAVPADQEAGRAAGEDLLRDLATDDYGAAVIGTGAGRDAPLDVEGATHGVLTQALLDGLGGTADSSGDGMVALDELERFVKDRVKALSGNRQRAVTGRPAMVRPFPVFRAQNANSREAATP